jgi:hypothetical protein
MARVTAGKRAGEKKPATFRPVLLVLALGVTLCVVAWGYLVYAAIDFGSSARQDGDTEAWWLLGLASLGAVACLFLGFMLVARFARTIGWSTPPPPKPRRDPDLPRGGKRAAR